MKRRADGFLLPEQCVLACLVFAVVPAGFGAQPVQCDGSGSWSCISDLPLCFGDRHVLVLVLTLLLFFIILLFLAVKFSVSHKRR